MYKLKYILKNYRFIYFFSFIMFAVLTVVFLFGLNNIALAEENDIFRDEDVKTIYTALSINNWSEYVECFRNENNHDPQYHITKDNNGNTEWISGEDIKTCGWGTGTFYFNPASTTSTQPLDTDSVFSYSSSLAGFITVDQILTLDNLIAGITHSEKLGNNILVNSHVEHFGTEHEFHNQPNPYQHNYYDGNWLVLDITGNDRVNVPFSFSLIINGANTDYIPSYVSTLLVKKGDSVYRKYSDIYSHDISGFVDSLQQSDKFNKDLALNLAKLSLAAEDKNAKGILDAYDEIGISPTNIGIGNYEDYTGNLQNLSNHGSDYAFALGSFAKTINDSTINYLVITCRGSTTISEFFKDLTTSAKSDFFGYTSYDAVYDFEESVFQGINKYLDSHPFLKEAKNLKVIVTGHSLGGAAANLVSARFDKFTNDGAWWSKKINKGDIYAYTFGAIDSLYNGGDFFWQKKFDVPVSHDYENIHNVFNKRDTFGPNGEKLITTTANSMYGKFGHLDLFDYDFMSFWDHVVDSLPISNIVTVKEAKNHIMPGYFYAIQNNMIKENCKSSDTFYRVRIACPVDLSISSNNDNTSVRNNEVFDANENIPVTVVDNVKYLVLENSKDYHIDIIAKDNGIMSFEVDNPYGGIKYYQNISLSTDKSFSCDFNNNLKNDDVHLYVTENNQRIREVQIDGSEIIVQEVFLPILICCIILCVIIVFVAFYFVVKLYKRKKINMDTNTQESDSIVK